MMKKRLLFILALIFVGSGAAISVAAQAKTVTNRDLEKFRQVRLQAEQEYRENYAKLGFPSPEELERQREQDAKDRSELAARIRQENLEREKIQAEAAIEQDRLEMLQSNSVAQGFAPGTFYGGNYYPGVYVGTYPLYGYSNRYFNNFYRRGVFGRRNGNLYRSPGVFGRPAVRFNSRGGVRINVRIGGGRANGGGRRR